MKKVPFLAIVSESPGTALRLLQTLATATRAGHRYRVTVVAKEGLSAPERRLLREHGWQSSLGAFGDAQNLVRDSAHQHSLLLRALDEVPAHLLPAPSPEPTPVPVKAPVPVQVAPPPPPSKPEHLRNTSATAPTTSKVWQAPEGKRAAFLVATHHRASLLDACLRHLSMQVVPTGWEFEILVGGEAGDPGALVVRAFPETRFIPVSSSKVTDKLNRLAGETIADLILMADDDDLQSPHRLEAAVRAYEEGYAWSASGLHRFINIDTGQVARWEGPAASGHLGTTVSVKRTLFREVGGYPSVPHLKDGHLASRIRTGAPTAQFKDLSGEIGATTLCLQHAKNIHQRPFPEKGHVQSRGKFVVHGEGFLADVVLYPEAQATIQGLRETFGTRTVVEDSPVQSPVHPQGPALTCANAGPGQSAYIDGLLDLGFQVVSPQAARAALAAGKPVLGHGWWSNFHQFTQHPGKFFTLWHSGFAGSDLMGEGDTLAVAMHHARQGNLKILWLERRDTLPAGAVHMVPVWSPERMAKLAEPRPPKIPNTVLVAFHGKYPSNAKNILASVAGAAKTTGKLHLSNSSFDGARGRVVREILAGREWVSHNVMSRQEAVRLVSSMTVMSHVSLSDTWPYLVMEAIYAGTPVVLCDVVNWTQHLSDWAKERCVVRPATSSEAIREKIQHLLDHPEDRTRLVEEQRAVLNDLAPKMMAEAADILGKLGFPVVAPMKVTSAPAPLPPPSKKVEVMPVSRFPTFPVQPATDPGKIEGKRDLRSQVPVFVIASGEPSLASCHQHLDNQDCVFQRRNIYNEAPMDRAFQRMLDECTTPYYVQVDADMLLEPWAVSGLYDAIKAREEELGDNPIQYGFKGIAQVVAWLWDDDVERPIQGVKIYRHAICRLFPYVESLSCEQGQNLGLKDAGYQVLGMPLGDQDLGGGKWRKTRQTFGRHYPSQTPAMAFERWQRLMQKHRKLPWMGWLGEYPQRLEARWLANPTNEVYKAQYLGCIAGLTGPIPEGERDFRQPNQDYRRVAAYVGEYSKGPREITIYLTDRCNFRCVFGDTPCKRESEEGVPKEGDLTPEFLRTILQTYPSLRSCCIAGFGEPLLHPDLPELIKVLAEHKLFIGIISNGSLVTKKVDLLTTMPIGYLSVSLNAATAEEHQAMSRTKTWDKVLEGLRIMAKSKVRTGVSFVVTNHNTKRIPDFLALCKDLGVQFVHLHNVLPHDGVKNLNFLNDVLTPQSTQALADIERAKNCPGAELVEVWPQVVDLKSGPPGACMSPFVSIGIDGKGNVSGCRRVDPPEQSFGGCFGNAWRNPHYTSLIAQITGDREDTHPACKGCFGNWKG